MTAAPLPSDELDRLVALDALGVMRSPPERCFDDLALAASRACDVPIGIVALVGEHEQWWTARVGVTEEGTARAIAFCAHALSEPATVMVVVDATRDPRFHDNPLVAGPDGVRFFAGAPIVTDGGHALGALCAVDRVPRQLSPAQVEVLQALARTTMTLLASRSAVRTLEARLVEHVQFVRQVQAYKAEVEAAHERLRRDALHDPLTGLYNQRALMQRLDEELPRAQRSGLPLAAVALDVDRFGRYNDTYGLPAGDESLVTLATILASVARAQDLVYRVAGDRFVLLLPATAPEGALVLAERLRRTLHGYAWPRRTVTASFGVAALGDEVASRDDLMRALNEAVRDAKQGGRDRVSVAGRILTQV